MEANKLMNIKLEILDYIQGLPIELIRIEHPFPNQKTKNVLITAGVSWQ